MLSKNAYLWLSFSGRGAGKAASTHLNKATANSGSLPSGYDSSTFNAVQGSKNWQKYFHEPDPNVIGSVNTAYTVGGIVAGPVYISELAPSTTRGKIMSFWQMNFSVGSFMAYWSAARLGDWDWKTVMICQLIAPVLIIANIWHVPESPRWLVQKDRTEDALAALQRLRDSPEDIEFEMQEMHHAMAFEKEAISGAYMPLWTDKTVRYRLMLAIVLNVGQQLTGQGSLNIKPSWGAVTWIWIGEVFSMNVRSQAVAISAQSQNVANAVLQQVFPLFLAKKGFYAMYLFFGINIVLFVFVWYMIPETKNKTLETMDVLFGGVNHADKGVMMEEDGKVQELTENIELVESRKSHDAEQIKQAGATKEIKV
ncbi:putative Low-affinity glucose transporter HXT1 [Glarea lozoyensis 74030]|uniref:Putative Low-affinity glucose transporter HXT1 n=1 Tax=Glarea lozoyensis (strain ATCC 74030 / MF5533) TaxID=1104152 RepID=H0EZ73_GLAL7|nr:putative Low-affinity glucose transporter HXT1 [Glarea lozoyensis 74030]